ncbi:MAG: MFS transporter [Opitutales bacterium]
MSRSDSENSNRSTLAILFIVLFMDLAGFSIIFPLFPAMLEHYLAVEGESGGLINIVYDAISSWSGDPDDSFRSTVFFGGVLGSIYAFLQFFSSPIWGSLSDRFGRRPIMILTVGGWALSHLLWIFSARFEMLVIARVFSGLMAGNVGVATAIVADITAPEKRSKSMALVGVALGLGFIIGPAIGGLTANWIIGESSPGTWLGLNPFSGPATIACACSALSLVWIVLKLPETLPAEKRSNAQRSALPPILKLGQSSNATLAKLIFAYFMFMFAFSGMEFTVTFFAVDSFDYTPMQNGMMFVFIGMVLILSQGGLVRRLAPKIGDRKMATAGMLLGAVGFLILSASSSSQAVFYTALAIIGIGISFINPTVSSLVSLISKETEQGRNLGIFRSSGSLARAVGPILGSIVYFIFSPQASYIACFACGILALGLFTRVQISDAKSQ